jgi:hypothetical protein
MSRSALAVLISVAGLLPAAAGDPFTGNLTEPQIRAIKLATIARFAGTKNTCPRVHFVEVASFKAMADTGIGADVIGSTEFSNVVAEAALVAIEKQRENQADFCAAVWQLVGPTSIVHWQMLESD